MRLEFDPAKDAANVSKHKLSFKDFNGFDGPFLGSRINATTTVRHVTALSVASTQRAIVWFMLLEATFCG